MPPTDGPDRGPYEEARPVLKVPSAGPDAALDLGGQFGLRPAAAPLHSLYQDGKLVIVQAAGMEHDTRSHFDAQEFIELGTPGKKGGGAGWLARHLQSGPIGEGEITSTSLGPLRPTSLLGDPGTLVLTDTQSYQLNSTDFLWRDAQRRSIRRLYESQNSFLHDSGVQALDTMDFVEAFVTEDYQPANGATYPQGEFGEQLQVIAQLMKLRVGLSVATLDLGGWDTHDNQGVGGGYFSNLVAGLTQGLAPFTSTWTQGETTTWPTALRWSFRANSVVGSGRTQTEEPTTDMATSCWRWEAQSMVGSTASGRV